MTFDTCIKVCVLTTQIKMYNISVTPKSFLMSHSKIPFPHPQLLPNHFIQNDFWFIPFLRNPTYSMIIYRHLVILCHSFCPFS